MIPKGFAIDPKYLAPTPKPVQEDKCNQPYLSGLFDTLLEDVEPPSGIFLLEMTQKSDAKELEFASLAAQQTLDSVHEEMFEMAQEQKIDSVDLNGFGEGDDILGMLDAAEKSFEERNLFNLDNCSFPSDLEDFSGAQQNLEQASGENMEAHHNSQQFENENMAEHFEKNAEQCLPQ